MRTELLMLAAILRVWFTCHVSAYVIPAHGCQCVKMVGMCFALDEWHYASVITAVADLGLLHLNTNDAHAVL